MENSRTSNFLGFTLLVAIFALTPACHWMETTGGRQILVVFRNAQDVPSGSAVYVAGVEVGRTSNPQVSNGRATVPIKLYRQQKGAVAAGTVFLVSRDPKRPAANCLTGYAAALSPDSSKPDEVFYGASTRLELVGLIGLEKAKHLVDQLTK